MAFYKYNTYGWYAGQCDASEPRSTADAPGNTSQSTNQGEIRANWTGYEWVDRPYQPPPAPDYSALAAKHWEAIKAERDRRTQQGGYQVAGKWFHSDTFSRTQQMALTMMGSSIPAGLQWKTMDGSFVTMTQAMASQVFAAAAASDATLFARAEQIKAAMESDPVNFILSAQTWPSVYGE